MRWCGAVATPFLLVGDSGPPRRWEVVGGRGSAVNGRLPPPRSGARLRPPGEQESGGVGGGLSRSAILMPPARDHHCLRLQACLSALVGWRCDPHQGLLPIHPVARAEWAPGGARGERVAAGQRMGPQRLYWFLLTAPWEYVCTPHALAHAWL
ncbi:hypothetical protein NDU88_001572 [Pleurodeles waltl]|uniref:Uncharacterized protein n=1 Tax=Pleurodeles waltl TaxID=8319 RepID=A0AAV7M0U7_PLEWA|nr:hypothetical protein NDU88_001572 [Pleurodeles waltl]